MSNRLSHNFPLTCELSTYQGKLRCHPFTELKGVVAVRYITVLNLVIYCSKQKFFLRNEIILCLLSADPYVRLDKCTNFDNPRLDQRFEVVDEEIVSICSKFARSEFHFHKP